MPFPSGGEDLEWHRIADLRAVWSWIWSDERQAQRSFQIFGMELLCDMDVRMLSEFFITFFRVSHVTTPSDSLSFYRSPRCWSGPARNPCV